VRSADRQLVQRLAQTWLAARDGWETLAESTRARFAPPTDDLGSLTQWLQPLEAQLGLTLTVDGLNGRCLAIAVALPTGAAEAEATPEASDRQPIIQAICRRLWQFNATENGRIRGVRIYATTADQVDPLWQQTIRIAAPAGRRELGLVGLAQLARDPAMEGVWRSLLLGGATIVPFVLALWLASAPPTTQNRVSSPGADARNSDPIEQVVAVRPLAAPVAERVRQVRSPVVQGALEPLPVVQHPAVNPADPAVTLMFGGDVTLSKQVKRRLDGDWGAALAQFPEARSVDLAMVNLENPITDATTKRSGKRFNFKAEPESVEALRAGGIDIVTLANNHTMDYNRSGLADTLTALDQAEIHAIGAGDDITEARRPKIMEVKGQRIAYFGYYNAHWHAATEGQAGTNPRDNDTLAADIQAVRDQVDWVVVNFHWGEELARYPAPYQREIGRRAIDAGADLVVGHHPHVLQGAEVYKDRAIVYSLGNFIFGGNSRSSYDTAVLKVSLKPQQMKLEFVPVRVRNYQPRVAKGDRAREILQELTYISRRFDRPLTSPMVLDQRSPEQRAMVATAEPTPTATAPIAPVIIDPVTIESPTSEPSNLSAPLTQPLDNPRSQPARNPAPQLPSFTRPASRDDAPITITRNPATPAIAKSPDPSSQPDTTVQVIQSAERSARDRLAQLIAAAELSELVRSNTSMVEPIEPAESPAATTPATPSDRLEQPSRPLSFEVQPQRRSSTSADRPSPQLPFAVQSPAAAPSPSLTDRPSAVAPSPGFTDRPAQNSANGFTAPGMASGFSSLSLPAVVKYAADRAEAMLEP
jgi:poly-gamma-glutamate synthesis protein (capsule biosynthesis protein)